MTDTSNEYVDAAIRCFDDGLNQAGFRTTSCGDALTDWEWSRMLGPGREPVTVRLNNGFPFTAPRVALTSRAGTADWHQTEDGVLCLWDTHAQGDLPWLDVPSLVARVEEWISNSAGGWADDAPQLDLEAYNNPRIISRKDGFVLPVLVVNAWNDIAGRWFRATLPADTGLMVVKGNTQTSPPPTPKRGSRRTRPVRRDKFVNGVAVDLGEMTQPFISTEALVEALGAATPDVAGLLDAALPVLVAARYSRSGKGGLIGFWLQREGDGLVRECLPVVDKNASQHRRAGWHASAIGDRTVSVVGVGSVGSYVADLLHRSGVHDLHVHDWDLLLPGNLVRHAASPAHVGAMKGDAVRDTAAERDPTRPIASHTRIATFSEAVNLLSGRDLVVDCTGDRRVWHLMRAAADIAGVSFLHVAVIGHGQYGRVDICPALDGAAPLDEDLVKEVTLDGWEGGCGDPVSPTPPTAVLETAAMGARFAIRMLAGEAVHPAGESRALFPDVP